MILRALAPLFVAEICSCDMVEFLSSCDSHVERLSTRQNRRQAYIGTVLLHIDFGRSADREHWLLRWSALAQASTVGDDPNAKHGSPGSDYRVDLLQQTGVRMSLG